MFLREGGRQGGKEVGRPRSRFLTGAHKNARAHALLLRPSGGTHSNIKFLFLPSSIIPLCPSQNRPRSLLFASSQFSSRKSSLIDNWRNHRWAGKSGHENSCFHVDFQVSGREDFAQQQQKNKKKQTNKRSSRKRERRRIRNSC